jgi:hypothetical protein
MIPGLLFEGYRGSQLVATFSFRELKAFDTPTSSFGDDLLDKNISIGQRQTVCIALYDIDVHPDEMAWALLRKISHTGFIAKLYCGQSVVNNPATAPSQMC